MNLHLCFHDRCFDGLASASLFSVFARKHLDPACAFSYLGLTHEPDGGLHEGLLGPDENVVLDFAYLPSDRLTWWFDHHRTAFEISGSESHFRGDQSGQKFYDPTAPSCTGFMTQVLADSFGFDPTPHTDLIAWAERIDSAAFSSPREAVELSAPALELMLWIERSDHLDDRIQVLTSLAEGGIKAALALPVVTRSLPDLLEAHRSEVSLIADHCHRDGQVVFCDLGDQVLDAVNKFVPYHLHPEASYAVIFSRGASSVKVSVGYNAWHDPEDRRHDISALCRREGGGGHPYVGAVSRPVDGFDALEQVARGFVTALNR